MNKVNPRLWNGGGEGNYYTAPFLQVAAYWFPSDGEKTRTVIGAEYKGEMFEGMSVETIPAAIWTVFSITLPTGIDYVAEAYTRVMTEWFPVSQYRRDEEVFPVQGIMCGRFGCR